MPKKIIPLGPWKRESNWYGEGFLMTAANVTPLNSGYKGGFLPSGNSKMTIGGAGNYTDVPPYKAYCTVKNIYALQYGATKTGKILRSTTVKNAGTMPTDFTEIQQAGKWTGDEIGSIAQYGKYLVICSDNDPVQLYDDETPGAVCEDLIKTTAPTGSSYATAIFKARFAAPYKNHMVLAYCTMTANYPSANTIYSNNAVLDSMVWISMTDNIRRYASPTVHPEVRGSIPLNILDDAGPITGIVGGEQLYIFKELAVYRLVGPPFDLVRISKDIGTISPHSIVEVGGIVYFMSNRGAAMIQGDQVQVINPESFANAIRGTDYNTEMSNRWNEITDMVPSLILTQTEMTTLLGTYSDLTNCIVWSTGYGQSANGKIFMMQAGPPFNMAHGDSLVVPAHHGDAVVPLLPDAHQFSAWARAPGGIYYTDGWTNNIIFGVIPAEDDDVRIVRETSSGFSCVDSTYPIVFTTPMIPIAMSENGPEVCRITGVRIMGEAPGTIVGYSVRTVKTWSDFAKITGRDGATMNSRDGWVNMPDSVHGRYHAICVEIVPGNYTSGPNYYLQSPHFFGIEVDYELAVGRSG